MGTGTFLSLLVFLSWTVDKLINHTKGKLCFIANLATGCFI